jgi:phospholipase C
MSSKVARIAISLLMAFSLVVFVSSGVWAQQGPYGGGPQTTTPIKHIVVIFQENVSFDHYFATYPYAQNTTAGEPKFFPLPGTPTVNNLLSGGLLTNNPNTVQPFRLSRAEAVTCDQNHSYGPEQQSFDHGLMDNFVAAVGSGDGTQTASTLVLPGGVTTITPGSPLQPGQYNTSQVSGGPTGDVTYSGYCFDGGLGPGIVMGYYDGNTVTAFWNYAQHFAMSDNSWSTIFGPSAPGAIDLAAGTTYPATMVPLRPNGHNSSASGLIWGGQTASAGSAFTGTLIGDARPAFDDCVGSNPQLLNTNQVMIDETSGVPANIGDLMGDLGFPNPATPVTWGWFQGGFGPTSMPGTIPAVCGSAGTGLAGFGTVGLPDNITTVGDYIPHHEPFMFYASSTNPHHLPPTSLSMIGQTDQANHQYDLSLFYKALGSGNLPSVSFLKGAAWEDGHPGYSDPLDEQSFVVNTVNTIMGSPYWRDTAIIIAYDDSDGWYDHTMDPVVNQSGAPQANTDVSGMEVDLDDALSQFTPKTSTTPAFGLCGTTPTTGPMAGVSGLCGYGTHQPLIVISPWAKTNYVDHSITDQSSILRFIEDNFNLGRLGGTSNDFKAGTLNNMFDFSEFNFLGETRLLILNPSTGQVLY